MKSNDVIGAMIRDLSGQFVDSEWICECLGIDSDVPGHDPVREYWLDIEDISNEMLLCPTDNDDDESYSSLLIDLSQPALAYPNVPQSAFMLNKLEEEAIPDEFEDIFDIKHDDVAIELSVIRQTDEHLKLLGNRRKDYWPRRGDRHGFKRNDAWEYGLRLDKGRILNDYIVESYIVESDELLHFSSAEFEALFVNLEIIEGDKDEAIYLDQVIAKEEHEHDYDDLDDDWDSIIDNFVDDRDENNDLYPDGYDMWLSEVEAREDALEESLFELEESIRGTKATIRVRRTSAKSLRMPIGGPPRHQQAFAC